MSTTAGTPAHSLNPSSEYEDAVSWEHVEETNTDLSSATMNGSSQEQGRVDVLSETFSKLDIGTGKESDRTQSTKPVSSGSPMRSALYPHSSLTAPPTIRVTPPDAVEPTFCMSGALKD